MIYDRVFFFVPGHFKSQFNDASHIGLFFLFINVFSAKLI